MACQLNVVGRPGGGAGGKAQGWIGDEHASDDQPDPVTGDQQRPEPAGGPDCGIVLAQRAVDASGAGQGQDAG
jgi:hypothetical protein